MGLGLHSGPSLLHLLNPTLPLLGFNSQCTIFLVHLLCKIFSYVWYTVTKKKGYD
jgi:hypothetical protein